MENPYESMAGVIVSLCPEFICAEMTLEADDDFLSVELSCTLPDGSETKPRVGGLSAAAVYEAIDEIKQHWPGEPFTGCIFRLRNDGSFDFDATYIPHES